MECSVIGAPFSYGQPFAGTCAGPDALREAGLLDGLSKLGWRLFETGDLVFKTPDASIKGYDGRGLAKNSAHVVTACKQISDAVFNQAKEDRFALVLGGDHSIALGSVAGVLRHRPETGVLWVDAHADINTPESSGSGNMHGMPLSFLTGLADSNSVPGLEWLDDVPKLPFQQLVYVGLRDVDRHERQFLKENGILAFTMFHIDKYGIGKVMEMALDALGDRPLHLSYDIDACDPLIAPHTGTAVRGGLTFREAHYVAEAVAETARLGSMDLVEVNPKLGSKAGDVLSQSTGEATVELGLMLITSAMGNRML